MRQKCKSCKKLIVHFYLIICPIIVKFCVEHNSVAVMLCVKFQNDRFTEIGVMSEWNFTKFESSQEFLSLWWTLDYDVPWQIYLPTSEQPLWCWNWNILDQNWIT